MKRILTAAVLIPLVLLAVFRAPLWLLVAITAVVALAAAWEYLGIVAGYGLEPFRPLNLLCVAGLFAMSGAAFVAGAPAMLGAAVLVLLFTPFLMLAAALGAPDLKAALPGAAMSYLALPYLALPLLLLAALRAEPRGWVYILFLFLAVWVGDTAAMYVGKSMGRHKLAPRISPGKTIEGTVASLVFAVAACTAFAHFLPEIAAGLTRVHLLPAGVPGSVLIQAPGYARVPLPLAAALAAAINAAAQVGDLMESALKRGAGVKDSGTMLPGHGGMLDRIDALLLASPVGFVLFQMFASRFGG